MHIQSCNKNSKSNEIRKNALAEQPGGERRLPPKSVDEPFKLCFREGKRQKDRRPCCARVKDGNGLV
jgi:hypothetical protein